MRRCFLSGVSVPLSAAKSRIVEAMRILLCQKYPEAQVSSGGKRTTYLSKWKLILKEYCALCARLYNFSGLMDQTKLALFTINQTNLQKWYKDRARREEIISRMQGLELPDPALLATTNLLPAHEQPLSPPPPPGPAHEFLKLEDTIGLARKRATVRSGTCIGQQIMCRVVSVSAPNFSNSVTVIPEVQQEVEVASQSPTMSRTTLYRHERKRWLEAAVAAGLEQPPPVQWKHKNYKVHECKQCHQPLRGETGYVNYYGS